MYTAFYSEKSVSERIRATPLPAHRICTPPRLVARTKRARSQSASAAARPATAIPWTLKNRNEPKMLKRLTKSRWQAALFKYFFISYIIFRKSRKIEAVIEESSSSTSSSSDSSNSTLPSYEVIDEKKSRRRKHGHSSDSSSSSSSSDSSSSSSWVGSGNVWTNGILTLNPLKATLGKQSFWWQPKAHLAATLVELEPCVAFFGR